MSLGKTLKTLREEHGIGQKELAAYLHVSIGTVSNYENDLHHPGLDVLCRIADFYGVSSDFLLGRTKCRESVEVLNRPVSGSYTVSDFLSLMERLLPAGRHAVAAVLELLSR